MAKLANRQPTLKPQDLLVLLALLSHTRSGPDRAGRIGRACLAQAGGYAQRWQVKAMDQCAA
jgi:hypothetical protein